MVLNRFISIVIGQLSKLVTDAGDTLTTDEEQEILVYSGDVISNNSGANSFGITSGSLKLEEILCSDEFKLNQLCSSKFEVQCFNLSQDVTGREIAVMCTENGVVKTLFTGVIESSTTDNFNYYRNIVAYDNIYYLRDKDVGSWWSTFWNARSLYEKVNIPSGNPNTNEYYEKQADNSYILTEDTTVVSSKTYYYGTKVATIKELRTSLLDAVGLYYDNVTLVNDNFQVKQYMKTETNSTSVKFSDLMSMICEINGCIGHINRSGTFEFKYLQTQTTKTIGQYDKVNVNFEDYTTEKITGINVYESTDALMLQYGGSTNCYIISGNIFTLTLDSYDILRTMCGNILNKIKDIQYIPCSIPVIVSDLDFTVGDFVKSDRGNHYVFSQSFSGSLLVDQTIECKAYGEVLNQNVEDISNFVVLNQKYSSIKQTQDEIKIEVGNKLNTSVFNQFADRIDMDFVDVDDEDYHKKLTTSITFNSEGINIKSDTDGVANNTQLQLTPNGAYIEDEQGEEVTSMTKNTFRTGEWVLQQTNDGKSFNIFKERRLS